MEKPASTTSNAASEALITEMHPLMPQAQGILFSPVPDRARSPRGKGIPIKVAGMATRGRERRILGNPEEPDTRPNSGERKKV